MVHIGNCKSQSLRDAVVLVTGAARGFGRAIVCQLMCMGATVIAGHRNPRAAKTLLDTANCSTGVVKLLQLDLEKRHNIAYAAARIEKLVGRLDILIHNAAVFERSDRSIETLNRRTIDAVLTVNVAGPLDLTRRLVPLLVRSSRPQIVSICSDDSAPRNVDGEYLTYAMSKATTNIMVAGLARQFTAKGFRVFGYDPGWMKTEMGGASAPNNPVDEARCLVDVLACSNKEFNGNIIRRERIASWWVDMKGEQG